VRLSVSDGEGGSASINVSITVVADPATGVRYRDPIFANVTETLNVKFGDGQLDGGGTQELFMDVYAPSGDSETNRAVMIIAHGGGFIGGNRQQETDTAISFARRGYVAATIDYRLIDGLPSDGDELSIGALKAVHDAFAAVRFFREDALGSNVYGTRPDAIFMGGVSAGGVIAAVAATFDDADTATSAALEDFRTANGGTAGNSSSNLSISSEIQGAMPISGAILDVNWIDAQSKPQYAAHDEFDTVVPCRTGAEGSTNTGLIVIGPCDYIPAYDALSITADLLLKLGSTGHVSFTEGERELIYTNAGALFLSEVIDP
ncbi:MAG: alpha/beta hydrolase, partial [Pseudomonadota bacterium]